MCRVVASWSVGRAAKRSRVIWPLSSAYHWTGISIPTWRVAACACGATSSKSNPQLSSQPARSRGRQRRTAAKIADTLFNHAPLRHAKITDRRRLATVWIIRPGSGGEWTGLSGRTGHFAWETQEYSSVICSARIRTDLLRGSAGRGLAENYLRPAGQPGGHRAKIIAAGQRNTRQLSGQRLFDQRRTGAAAGKIRSHPGWSGCCRARAAPVP